MPREKTDAEAYANDENPRSGSDEEVLDEYTDADDDSDDDSQSDPQSDVGKPEE